MNETKSTVKGLKKQMAAAVAMVTVAAVALGSSTYAWFANNLRVTADGMTVSATSEGSQLIIADTKENLYTGDKANQTSVGLNIEGASLHPVHPVYEAIGTSAVEATTSANWKHAYSDNFNTAITSASNEENLGTITLNNNVGKVNDDAYYLTGTIAVGLAINGSTPVNNLKVESCTIGWQDTANADQKALLNAARVMLTEADTNKVVGVYSNGKVLTQVGNAQTGNFGTDGFTPATADTMTAIDADLSNSPAIASTIATAIDTTTATSNAKLFNVYVYFDGRDADCKSAEFSASKLAVSLTFSATAGNASA